MLKKIDIVEMRKETQKKKFVSLAESYPDLIKEWDFEKNKGLKDKNGNDMSIPNNVCCNFSFKVFWKCKNGHSWPAQINERVGRNGKKGTGCPYCTNRKVWVGFNDLASTYPDIARQWNYELNGDLKPTDITYGSNKTVGWIDDYGHTWLAPIFTRVGTPNQKGTGCPYCANQKLLVGFNDLATKFPDIAQQLHPTKNGDITPRDIIATSNRKYVWLCPHGHEWKTSVAHRVDATKPTGCPYCSGRKAWPGETDFGTIHPHLLEEWDWKLNSGLNPRDFTENSDKSVYWKCPKGHSWMARINKRSRGHGCLYCTGQKVLPGFNDFKSHHPELLSDWDYDKNNKLPSEYTHCSGQKVYWKCKDGHSWPAKISNRVNGRNCPICNASHGEMAIKEVLLKHNIQFEQEYVFSDRRSSIGGMLRDDFAVIHNNNVIATIEYHGIQHYEPVDFAGKGIDWAKEQLKTVKLRDKEKSQYLLMHKIPQLIISYKDFNKVSVFVESFLQKLNLINH